MTPWYAVVVSTVGGAFATILGIFVGGSVSRRGQDRQWVRDHRAQTYSDFLREFGNVEIELRDAFFTNRSSECDWDSWNASLVSLSLVATPEAAVPARDMGLAVGKFAVLVEKPARDPEELKQLWTVLVDAQKRFVSAARRSLDATQEDIGLQLGGPLHGSRSSTTCAPSYPTRLERRSLG